MGTYTFVIKSEVSLGIEVEATSLEQAVAKAQSASVQGFCHQCSSGDPGEWSLGGEIDCGAPCDNELVDFYGPDGSGGSFFDNAVKAWEKAE